MRDFRVVEGSEVDRRTFSITCGLRRGYGYGATDEISLLTETFKHWMFQRAKERKPFLTGIVQSGNVCYAYPATGEIIAFAQEEPVGIVNGEINPMRHGDLSYADAKALLNELASAIGSALGQTRVYVTYRNAGWILQAVGSTTPAGNHMPP